VVLVAAAAVVGVLTLRSGMIRKEMDATGKSLLIVSEIVFTLSKKSQLDSLLCCVRYQV
jgi:hypothetical protein